MYPKERHASKQVGFALFYGAGPARIEHTFNSLGFMIPRNEAEHMYNKFKTHYQDAIKFHRNITRYFEGGGIINNLFGRPLKIQDTKDAYMKGFNTLIQSSASDLNLQAGSIATERWKEQGLDCKVLLLVHDCILAECREDDVEAADKILVESMTGFKLSNALGKIPLKVEGGVSDVWSKN